MLTTLPQLRYGSTSLRPNHRDNKGCYVPEKGPLEERKGTLKVKEILLNLKPPENFHRTWAGRFSCENEIVCDSRRRIRDQGGIQARPMG